MTLFHHVLEARPENAPALRGGACTFRYGDLAARSQRAAALLWHGWGLRAGDRIAWLGGNHAGLLVLLFAAARIGAIVVPLNSRLAQAEWRRLVADCTPRHVVHDAALAESAVALAQARGVPVHGVDELEQGDDSAAAPLMATPDSPVLLVYTSGTTGTPKAAVHTHANLLANMRIAAEAQRLTSTDRVLTVLPLFHVGGLCIQTLPALYSGAEVLLHARFEPGETLAAIARERPTLTLQVPATMKALIEHPQWPATDLSSLRAVWAGSSLIPATLVEAFHARGIPVCNVYGATETGPFSISLGPRHARTHVGSCGWPARGVEAMLVRDGGRGTDTGSRGNFDGEVLLRAPNIIDRYWPDVPARDADGWFHTGDLAMQAADGSYTIVGRAKELIISGGENIHPAEIEMLLAQHPAVAECAVFGVPDERWGEAVAAAVVRRDRCDEACDETALRGWLETRIARFKIPREWRFVDALPRTALGKIQRQLLANLPSSPSSSLPS